MFIPARCKQFGSTTLRMYVKWHQVLKPREKNEKKVARDVRFGGNDVDGFGAIIIETLLMRLVLFALC